MNQFYVSIIFLGIMLIVLSLFLIVYDRKKALDEKTLLDEKKNDLIQIVQDAEQMVQELNKFSDYLLTRIDQKNKEMAANVKSYEERMAAIQSKPLQEKVTRLQQANGMEKVKQQAEVQATVNVPHPVNTQINKVIYAKNYKQNLKSKEVHDKVIPFNMKYKEVLKMAQEGMDDTQIAKALNMGKGEIQLILGMHKII